MRALGLEPEIEELLLRLVPDLADEWEGATEDQIEQIEQIARRPLPRFYRWFLMRMGASMGALAHPTSDFSAARVLSLYAKGNFVPDLRFLAIAHESNEMMQLHSLYDFDFPARDDARVIWRHHQGGTIYNRFETFREMLGWGSFVRYRIVQCSHRCVGSLIDEGGDVLSQLGPLMDSLRFDPQIPTGPCCALYDAERAAMASTCEPGKEPGIHTFDLGGNDVGSLRKVLGEIASETSLEIEVTEWEPPVSSKLDGTR